MEENTRFLRAQFDAVELATGEDGSPPSRIKVMPWGKFELRDKRIREAWGEPGEYVVNERSVSEIPENFADRDIDYSVNEQHDRGGRALGWVTGMDVVAGEGVFFDLDWTPDGVKLLESRTYRYASGEVVFDASEWEMDKGPAVVIAATGLGLTNFPAVKGFEPIMAETLTEALSGSGSQDREGLTTPRNAGEKGEGRMDGASTFKGFFSRIIGKEPKDDMEAMEATLEVRAQLDRVPELEAQLETAKTESTTLAAELATLKQKYAEFEAAQAESKKAEVKTLVEAALASGKFAPSLTEWATELATTNREGFDAYCAATPDGTFAPPKGQQVTDAALKSADASTLDSGAESMSLFNAATAHAKEHNITYGEALRAIKKGA